MINQWCRVKSLQGHLHQQIIPIVFPFPMCYASWRDRVWNSLDSVFSCDSMIHGNLWFGNHNHNWNESSGFHRSIVLPWAAKRAAGVRLATFWEEEVCHMTKYREMLELMIIREQGQPIEVTVECGTYGRNNTLSNNDGMEKMWTWKLCELRKKGRTKPKCWKASSIAKKVLKKCIYNGPNSEYKGR